jgi:hypothetical protein
MGGLILPPFRLTKYQPSHMAIQWNTEKLNQYLFRIDGAIVSGRYNLALKLAHRCLRQYYHTFIKENNVPTGQIPADNVRLMAVYICKHLMSHFRKYEIPYSERRLLFISLVSNVIFISTMNLYSSQDDYLADKALATYARENVYSIISYMMRYFS